jgi:hypothetical protein
LEFLHRVPSQAYFIIAPVIISLSSVMPTAISRPKAPVLPPPVPLPADDQQLVHNLFTFSPFGLACHQCKKHLTIQLDERCNFPPFEKTWYGQ